MVWDFPLFKLWEFSIAIFRSGGFRGRENDAFQDDRSDGRQRDETPPGIFPQVFTLITWTLTAAIKQVRALLADCQVVCFTDFPLSHFYLIG